MIYILYLCFGFCEDINIITFSRAFTLLYYVFPYEISPLFPGGFDARI